MSSKPSEIDKHESRALMHLTKTLFGRIKRANVVFCFDTSASMYPIHSQIVAHLKDALFQMHYQFKAPKFNVVVGGEQSDSVVSFANEGLADCASKQDITACSDWLAQLPWISTCSAFHLLQKAFSFATSDTAVYFVTDGCLKEDVNELVQHIAHVSRGKQLHCVMTTMEYPWRKSVALRLEELAFRTGGHFQVVLFSQFGSVRRVMPVYHSDYPNARTGSCCAAALQFPPHDMHNQFHLHRRLGQFDRLTALSWQSDREEANTLDENSEDPLSSQPPLVAPFSCSSTHANTSQKLAHYHAYPHLLYHPHSLACVNCCNPLTAIRHPHHHHHHVAAGSTLIDKLMLIRHKNDANAYYLGRIIAQINCSKFKAKMLSRDSTEKAPAEHPCTQVVDVDQLVEYPTNQRVIDEKISFGDVVLIPRNATVAEDDDGRDTAMFEKAKIMRISESHIGVTALSSGEERVVRMEDCIKVNRFVDELTDVTSQRCTQIPADCCSTPAQFAYLGPETLPVNVASQKKVKDEEEREYKKEYEKDSETKNMKEETDEEAQNKHRASSRFTDKWECDETESPVYDDEFDVPDWSVLLKCRANKKRLEQRPRWKYWGRKSIPDVIGGPTFEPYSDPIHLFNTIEREDEAILCNERGVEWPRSNFHVINSQSAEVARPALSPEQQYRSHQYAQQKPSPLLMRDAKVGRDCLTSNEFRDKLARKRFRNFLGGYPPMQLRNPYIDQIVASFKQDAVALPGDASLHPRLSPNNKIVLSKSGDSTSGTKSHKLWHSASHEWHTFESSVLNI